MSDRNRVVFTDGNEEEIIETEMSQRNPNAGLKNGIIQKGSVPQNQNRAAGVNAINQSENASPRSVHGGNNPPSEYNLTESDQMSPRRRFPDIKATSGQKASLKRGPINIHDPDASAKAIMDNEEDNLRNSVAVSERSPTQPDIDKTVPNLSMTILDQEEGNEF